MTREIKTNKARQGRSGWPVLVVVLCALALALAVWVVVGFYGEAIAPENPIGDPTQTEEPTQPAN